MKRFFLCALALALFSGNLQVKAQNDDVKLYFTTSEMPDLI